MWPFLLMLAAAPEPADRMHGAPIPPGARKLAEEGRVVSPRNYDDTIEFYDRLYKNNAGYRFRPIVSAPNVKAVHLQNVRSAGGWSGLNIYETKNQTRIFVLKAEGAPPAQTPAPKKK